MREKNKIYSTPKFERKIDMTREKKGKKRDKKGTKKGQKKGKSLPNEIETKKFRVGKKTMFLKRSQ